jgi:hypothetical protein
VDIHRKNKSNIQDIVIYNNYFTIFERAGGLNAACVVKNRVLGYKDKPESLFAGLWFRCPLERPRLAGKSLRIEQIPGYWRRKPARPPALQEPRSTASDTNRFVGGDDGFFKEKTCKDHRVIYKIHIVTPIVFYSLAGAFRRCVLAYAPERLIHPKNRALFAINPPKIDLTAKGRLPHQEYEKLAADARQRDAGDTVASSSTMSPHHLLLEP